MEISCTLSSEEIKKKVELGEYTLFEKANMRSMVWQRFRGVLNEYGEEIFGVSCCEKCFSCFRYKAIKDGKNRDFGTKNLRDHFVYCGLPRSKGKRSRHKHDQLQQHQQQQRQQQQIGDLNEYHQPTTANVQSFKIQVGTENNNEHSVVIHPNNNINEQLSEVEMTVECGKENESMFEAPVCKVETIGRQFLDEIDHHIGDSRFQSEPTSSPTEPAQSLPKIKNVESSSSVPTSKRKKRPDKPGGLSSGLRFTCATPEYSPSSSSSSSSVSVLKEDEHDIFGRHVANELRSLPQDSNRRWARFHIQKILYEAHSHNE